MSPLWNTERAKIRLQIGYIFLLRGVSDLGTLLGMTLNEYMSQHRLTDQAFADAIGFSRMAVGKWRRGERAPRPRAMQAIIEVTRGKVTANDFYAGTPENAA